MTSSLSWQTFHILYWTDSYPAGESVFSFRRYREIWGAVQTDPKLAGGAANQVAFSSGRYDAAIGEHSTTTRPPLPDGVSLPWPPPNRYRSCPRSRLDCFGAGLVHRPASSGLRFPVSRCTRSFAGLPVRGEFRFDEAVDNQQLGRGQWRRANPPGTGPSQPLMSGPAKPRKVLVGPAGLEPATRPL